MKHEMDSRAYQISCQGDVIIAWQVNFEKNQIELSAAGELNKRWERDHL